MPKRRAPTYDAKESQRRKHRWDEPRAAFVFDEERDMEVGRCSSEIDDIKAQRLLEQAVPWNPTSWRKAYPKMLYNVFRGVPYRAHQMGGGPGGRYHGFPEKPDHIPVEIRDELRRRATKEGSEEQFDAWMRQEGL